MSHTPTPWKVTGTIENAYINGHSHMLFEVANEDTGVCVVILPHEDATPQNIEERKATAAFIALSANSHANLKADRDALLKALKLSLGALENLAVLISSELGVDWADHYGADFESWDKAVDASTAAIAAVEKES